jgi:hypothetical protein
MSNVRRPSRLLLAATLAASLNACGGDAKAPDHARAVRSRR